MTGPGAQPNKLVPATAANATSFGAFANTSQADWKNTIDGGVGAAFGPLVEICTLIEEVPIFLTMQLLGAGGGVGKTIIADLIKGMQIVVDFFCELATGTSLSGGSFTAPAPPPGTTMPPSGTTVYSVMGGAASATNTAVNSPFLGGLLQLGGGVGSGGLGGLIEVLLNGLQFFVDILCNLVTTGTNILGAGIGGITGGTTGTSPLSIITGLEQVVTAILGSPIVSELIGIGEGILTSAENVALSLVTGVLSVFDQFLGIFTSVIGGVGNPISIQLAGFTDLFGLLGPIQGVGTGQVTLPPLSSIGLLGSTQDMFNHQAMGFGYPGGSPVSPTSMQGLTGSTASTAASALQSAAQAGALQAAQKGAANSNGGAGGTSVTITPFATPGAVWT